MLASRRHAQAPALIAWLERNGASLSLSVLTIAEMDAGILKLRRKGKAARCRRSVVYAKGTCIKTLLR